MCCIDNILYIVGGAGKNNMNNLTSNTEKNTKLAKHKLFSSLNSIDFYDENSKMWKFLTEMNIPR